MFSRTTRRLIALGFSQRKRSLSTFTFQWSSWSVLNCIALCHIALWHVAILLNISAETNSTIFEYSIVTVPFECLSTYTNYLGKYVIGPHVMFTCFEMASWSKSCVKSRPLRSPVWDYFEISGDKKVRCKLCVPPAATTLAYHGGTTSMQSHLLSHHPDKYYIDQLFGIRSLRKPLLE